MAVSPVRAIPEGYHQVTPSIVVDDADKALAFYRDALGAQELYRLPVGDKVGHAEMQIGDSRVMLSDEFPQWGAASPKTRGGATGSLMLYVPDVDAAFDRALKAGATVVQDLQDQFWGDRTGAVADPFGHKWLLATHVEDVPPEEMQRRSESWAAQQQG
jgi:Uncharacterized protein conserved in bacteria